MADGEGVVAPGNQQSGVIAERWKRVETVFEQALETPAETRTKFLEETCAGDAELRIEVESLLKAHGEAGDYLDEPDHFFSSDSFPANGAALAPGERIDRYRIIREIGRGGMGAVFLAERADEQYQKQVAIKLIKRGMDTDAVLRHFRNERQILAGFDHPNIARLYDGGTTETGLPFFVMEYVEGLPIDEYCKAQALSVAQRLKLFREVCAAVSYAHRHLVIHRDIKRSNILITPEGVPKLLDFGIAKILQHGDEAEPLATMTGLRPMTPQYASPEQLRGEPMTTASDVYSLGVVLYELLTGQSPYGSTTPSPDDFPRVVNEIQPKKPSTVTGSNGNQKLLRGDLDNIVLMALRKEPERRYQSVEQFSEDIRRHLEERPVVAGKDTVSYRAGKFVRRNKGALAAAALVLIFLVGGIITTTWQAQKARAQEAVAKAEKVRAERRFNDVRKLAHSVLFDYYEAIKFLPGATKVRELLVKDALSYLDSLAGEAHGDPGLQRELSAAYERVGDVRGGAGGSLGDSAGALESYTRAFAIREALVAANPNDAQAQSDLASSHRKIGMQLQNTTEASKGVEHLRKAVAMYLDLARERGADDDLLLDFADTRNKLAGTLRQLGDHAGALEQYQAALAICEKPAASNPKDLRYRRALLNTHSGISTVLSNQDDVAGAIEENNKTIALAESLLGDDPTNAQHRRAVTLRYKRSADLLSQSDKPAALEYFRKAVALEEESVTADPANATLRNDLAYTHKRIADFVANLHDYAQALPHFSKALELFEKLASDAPADLGLKFTVAVCRAGVAGMQARLGETDSALAECRKAIALLGEIKEDPTNMTLRRSRGEAYEYVGYAYLALAESPKASAGEKRQHTTAARDMFQESINLADDLRRRNILGADGERWSKNVAGEKAKCDAALGK